MSRRPCACCDVLRGVGIGTCRDCARMLAAWRELQSTYKRQCGEILDEHVALHDARAVPGLELDLAAPEGTVAELLDQARAELGGPYEPTPAEREIAARYPGLAWLVHTRPAERKFYSQRANLVALIERNPEIEEDEEWRIILALRRRSVSREGS